MTSVRNQVLQKRLEQLADSDPAEVLSAPVVEKSKHEKMNALLGGGAGADKRNGWADAAAIAGLTIGDLVYDASRVDPLVLEATDFARVQDLSNVFEYSVFADEVMGGAETSINGNVANLQGYVAERIAAQQQQSMGKEVEFPEDSNQEGYDLIINGQPFQVKCHANRDGIDEHLDEHPDIPILVNQELADDFSANENVYAVPGLEYDKIVGSTRSTLEAGDEMLDFEIPFIAVAIASGRNIKAIVEGRTDWGAAIYNVAFDVGGRAAGGVVGAKALAAAGLVFGPAGVVVGGLVGAVVGASGGKHVARVLRAKVMCAAEERTLTSALQSYFRDLQHAAVANLGIVDRKHELFARSLRGGGPVKTQMWDDFGWRLEQEHNYRKSKIADIEIAGNDPKRLDSNGADLLVSTGEALRMMTQLGVHPYAVRTSLSEVEDAASALVKERKRHLV